MIIRRRRTTETTGDTLLTDTFPRRGTSWADTLTTPEARRKITLVGSDENPLDEAFTYEVELNLYEIKELLAETLTPAPGRAAIGLCCKESAKKRIGAVDEIYEEGGIVKVSRN